MEDNISNFEERKLALEEKKLKNEFSIQRKELKLRKLELDQRVKESNNKGIKLNPTQATIFVAVIGLLGTYIGALFQGYNNQALEKLKFESQIILKAATSNDIEQNKKNLKFLLDAGFISDPDSNINTLVNDSTFNLKIETHERVLSEEGITLSGNIIDKESGYPISDARITITSKSYLLSEFSNKSGFFFIYIPDFPTREKFIISCQKKGYIKASLSFDGEYGTNIPIRFIMTKSP